MFFSKRTVTASLHRELQGHMDGIIREDLATVPAPLKLSGRCRMSRKKLSIVIVTELRSVTNETRSEE
ncbi:hypothetical protein A2707_04875 [Candidatus Saccharibacteria bacterium RIFCSPHIGHO2_01_FULL_45_15]|nr:MAG: hypothetical protein A2707_04875 [Candidatus Saccharibacteria bacterium RIFCSPHIGHO2_01_FULL_45_15]OGL27912.1 MAG: hypothetical protein A3C39_03870 [Candidatus Saccharibacteria bacterium RIFCSPHIGHO2_02_FULL_46_12]